ncbi:acyltransferase family protein [Demequina subtropica]|uniref:acyltransferase family protein n=1 Tax=Demequina subtropica TaxID=1638989 RepID=UPI0007817F4C|nr:acyltransferase family protein [Demequina subtropica]
MRPEIQALRAAAILAVVVYHLWPHRLTGGYVGVDVFFVVSGYLITAHLIRDLARGTRAPFAFWARRIRRLMPASLLTLLVAGILTILFVPVTVRDGFLTDVVASAFYVQNWHLAASSVDYLSATAPPSLVQHFWTLSVEEQFYVVWPLVLLAAGAVLRRRARYSVAGTTLVLASIAFIASFAYGWYAAVTDPTPSFFITTGRIWEFAIGAMLAAYVALRGGRVPGLEMPAPAATATAWAGWALIALSFVAFTSTTLHPGPMTLIPVVGTALILAAGDPAGRIAPRALVSLRPVQRIGDWSYSLYLWHWPLIALAPFVVDDATSKPVTLSILAASFVLAYASYRWVERPVLDGKVPGLETTARAMIAMAIGMAIVVAAPFVVQHRDAQAREAGLEQLEQLEDASSAANACRGAEGVTDPECAGQTPDDVVPALEVAPDDWGTAYADADCGSPSRKGTRLITCEHVGGDGSGAKVLLVGDSHARHLFPMGAALADEHDWTLTLAYKTGCPYSDHIRTTKDAAAGQACATWNDSVDAMIADDGFDLVITSQWASAKNQGTHAEATAGFVDKWTTVVDSGARVLAVKDLPAPSGDTLACLAQTAEPWDDACTNAEAEALRFDPLVEAADAFDSSQVQAVDLDDAYCWDGTCHAVVAGAIVYGDRDGHMTATWSRTLAPVLDARVPAEFLTAHS